MWAPVLLIAASLAVLGANGRMLLSGALPRHLAAERVASSVTIDVLQRASTNEEAVAKAQNLYSALQSDYTRTINNLFVAWVDQHDHEYPSLTELDEAIQQFAVKVEEMVHHNLKAESGHWRGLNKRSAHLPRQLFNFHKATTPTLFAKCPGGKIPYKVGSPKCKQAGADPPQFDTNIPPRNAHNWRTKGYTTPVTDIGDGCAAAWAHAGASALDAGVAIFFNSTPLKGSRQSLISCIAPSSLTSFKTQFNSFGCNGGSTSDVYNYLNLKTLPLDYTVPYTSGSSGVLPACQTQYSDLNTNPIAGVNGSFVSAHCPPTQCGTSGATFYSAGSANFTRYAVGGGVRSTGESFPGQVVVTYWSFLNQSDPDNTGPCANPAPGYKGPGFDCDFMNYQGGVFTGSVCFNNTASMLNHAMSIVGFNLTADPPYWILQNSWGSSWGDGGFINVLYSGLTIGACGMYTQLMGPNATSLNTNVRPEPVRFNSRGQPPVVACSTIAKKFCHLYPTCVHGPYNHCADP